MLRGYYERDPVLEERAILFYTPAGGRLIGEFSLGHVLMIAPEGRQWKRVRRKSPKG
jgi:hypothetical protein